MKFNHRFQQSLWQFGVFNKNIVRDYIFSAAEIEVNRRINGSIGFLQQNRHTPCCKSARF